MCFNNNPPNAGLILSISVRISWFSHMHCSLEMFNAGSEFEKNINVPVSYNGLCGDFTPVYVKSY